MHMYCPQCYPFGVYVRMMTMLCISKEFQYDDLNIDGNSMRKLVDNGSINNAFLCLPCHVIKMRRKYASVLHIPSQVQDTEIGIWRY
jgi:hypothetical protein